MVGVAAGGAVTSTAGTGDKVKLPPGMVLGPDGKPCKVCSGFKAWSASQGKAKAKASSSSSASSAIIPAVALASSLSPTLSSTADDETSRKDCPADVERLGRHTWTFLHTSASYYPLTPTPHHQSSMLSLLTSLPTLYPCSSCASELGDYMKLHPPNEAVRARGTLEQWLCGVHNEVNERLGKEKFDCDKTGERWRDGPSDGRCD